LLTSDERSLDKLIERLDVDLDSLQKEKAELDRRMEKARLLEEVNVDRQKKLDRREEELQVQHLEELDQQIKEGRRELDRMIRDIRQSQAHPEKVKEGHRKLKDKSEAISKRRAKQKKTDVGDKRTLKTGERVWIEKFKTEGDVVEMLGDKKVKVAIGKAFMTVDTIDVKRLDRPTPDRKQTVKAGVNAAAANDFRPEIMLRGMTVDEAVEALDKFLDDALIAGVGQVYVVHGKGTGRLRKNLSSYLKSHPAVDSIRIGDWNEGGHGVTIARLKV
jgi:DNA mismatch repair protein MutS2